MSKFHNLIPFEEAVRRIRSQDWNPIEKETVQTSLSSGRILFSDVAAVADYPAWNRSLVDGYAVRSLDVSGASATNPVELGINGVIEAGASSFTEYREGECTEIYTGGMLPADYDSVVMAEDAERHGDRIRIMDSVHQWENVERKGEDISSGTKLLQASQIIRPWHISAMVSSNVTTVQTYRKIRVSVLSTGNELFPESLGHISNTTQMLYLDYLNRPFISTANAGMAHDDQAEIANLAEDALKNSDCLIITGGTSLGGKDEVPEAISQMGEVVFAGSMIRPGRTLTLYNVNGKPVFSVSGIPVPSLLSFDVFFEEYLKAVTGLEQYRTEITGVLQDSLSNKAGYAGIYRVRCYSAENSNIVELIRTRGTGTMHSMLKSNGTLIVPGDVEGLEAGSIVRVKLFGDVR